MADRDEGDPAEKDACRQARASGATTHGTQSAGAARGRMGDHETGGREKAMKKTASAVLMMLLMVLPARAAEPVRALIAHAERPVFIARVIQRGDTNGRCAHPTPERLEDGVRSELLRAGIEVIPWREVGSLNLYGRITIRETGHRHGTGCVGNVRIRLLTTVVRENTAEETGEFWFSSPIWSDGAELIMGGMSRAEFHEALARASHALGEALGDEMIEARAAVARGKEIAR